MSTTENLDWVISLISDAKIDPESMKRWEVNTLSVSSAEQLKGKSSSSSAFSSGSHRRFRARRLKPGYYEYRGLVLRNHGYYPPDQQVWWEAFDPETGDAEHHARTMRELKSLIDEYYEQ